MSRPFRFGGASHGAWLVPLFLIAGVVAPTGCVLWFMNQAAQSQAESARQSVMEAYRGQLRLIRDRVDADWKKRAADLERQAGAGTPEDFVRIARGGLVDSIVYLRADGSIAYPAPLATVDNAILPQQWRQAQALEVQQNASSALGAYSALAKSDVSPNVAARAAQGEIRMLLKMPNAPAQKEAAVRAVFEYFSAGKLVNATDSAGRMIAADEYLWALRLMGPKDWRRKAALDRLTRWVNDYRLPMPSAQRLFLTDELLALGAETYAFPLYQPERIAAEYLEADTVRPTGSGLQPTRVPRLWRMTVAKGRVIVLYREETVARALRAILDPNSTDGARFAAIPPGQPLSGDSLAASVLLPGWQIGFDLTDTRPMEEASRRRRAAYLWVGYVVICAMCVTGLLVGQAFRRQLRLARLKTDLVAAVSHELKTPLASMRLLVDSLLEDAELDPRKTREYLALIAGENLRLTRLIENFLTFSRIERNRQRFVFADTPPAVIVESAHAALRERFQQPGCQLEIAVDPDLPAIHADSDALATVLVNLLDNAYKYTRDDKRVEMSVYQEARGVVFAVRDNGIGIAPADQRRIFRRFYQVDQRLARQTGGCGLGLSIVDSIVRAHGGSVHVTSTPGEGSTFTVLLPCRAPVREAAA